MSNDEKGDKPGENDKPFSSCAEELKQALANANRSLSEEIITSRDPGVKEIIAGLSVFGSPVGFTKWRLPFFFQGEGVNFYISTASPFAKVDSHSHEHGPVVRFILEGTIFFNGTEMATGDWMFIPPGVEYEFEAGERGAVVILGYECCC